MIKLSKLSFLAGPGPGQGGIGITDPEVVLLVGPNNSGKSLALREIENWCIGKNEARKVVDQLDVELPDTADAAIELFEPFKAEPPQNQTTPVDHIWVGSPTFRQGQPVIHVQISLATFRNWFDHAPNRDHARTQLTLLYTVRLDGRTRFALSDPKPAGDLQSHPQNHLWALFQNDPAREKVRSLTSEAFGLHFIVDATGMTQFRVRMSSRPPVNKAEEQALDAAARAFHQRAPLASELSDGIQAFTGLVSAVMSLPHRILLIDEPEAFLHPPLARRLGRNLCDLSKERGATLLVATHSAEFVMGCIESGAAVQILRLTFENPRATTRLLSTGQLRVLMNDPLLRSAQALRGLFHRGVVVTEADKDRAFYEEINYRLQVASRGVSDTLFMNAQNWQTIPRLVRPLRTIGIAAAAIMDLDVLEQEQSWHAIYDMIGADAPTRASIEQRRQLARAGLLAAPMLDGRKSYKLNGIAAVPEEHRADVQGCIDELAQYGLFIVAKGEVECWLTAHGITHDPKVDWLSRAFSYMRSDPSQPTYMTPGADGVWEFIEAVGRWITDPNRRGMA